MRLAERTLIQVKLAPRMVKRGELGGLEEAFFEETIALRASVLPEGGSVAAGERGMVYPEKLRLLVPRDTQAAPGDGIWLEGSLYRIMAVERWSAHMELICEAKA